MDNHITPPSSKAAPNFTYTEFFKPEDPPPRLPSESSAASTATSDASQAIWQNITLLAQRLQVLRDIVGKPLTITSGYRSPERNRQVGGSSKSYHLNGMAADLPLNSLPKWLEETLWKNWSGGMGLYADHIHLDIGPRRRWHG